MGESGCLRVDLQMRMPVLGGKKQEVLLSIQFAYVCMTKKTKRTVGLQMRMLGLLGEKAGGVGSGGGRSASPAKQHEHSYSHMYCYQLHVYAYVCDQKNMKDSRFTNAYAWP